MPVCRIKPLLEARQLLTQLLTASQGRFTRHARGLKGGHLNINKGVELLNHRLPWTLHYWDLPYTGSPRRPLHTNRVTTLPSVGSTETMTRCTPQRRLIASCNTYPFNFLHFHFSIVSTMENEFWEDSIYSLFLEKRLVHVPLSPGKAHMKTLVANQATEAS